MDDCAWEAGSKGFLRSSASLCSLSRTTSLSQGYCRAQEGEMGIQQATVLRSHWFYPVQPFLLESTVCRLLRAEANFQSSKDADSLLGEAFEIF